MDRRGYLQRRSLDGATMKLNETVHLGDGAYLHFDGYGVELRANHHETPTDRVYLEPSVIGELLKHLKDTFDLRHLPGQITPRRKPSRQAL
jgi:hypothetical protein